MEETHVDCCTQQDPRRLWREGAHPDAPAATRGTGLSLRTQGLQRQRHEHHDEWRLRARRALAERGGVPCPGLRDPTGRADRRDVARRDWPAAGSADTELGVLLEPEVGHGATEVYAR